MLKGVLKYTGRCYTKHWEYVENYCDMLCKNIERCYENMLRGFLQNYWEIFCKNAEMCSAKVLTLFLVCKNAEKCSEVFQQKY